MCHMFGNSVIQHPWLGEMTLLWRVGTEAVSRCDYVPVSVRVCMCVSMCLHVVSLPRSFS